MKKITLLFLFCLTVMLSASVPEWKYTFGKKEITITASVPANEYLYKKATAVELTSGGVAVQPSLLPQSVMHEDEFSGKTEIYSGGKVLTWIFRSDKWSFPLKLKVNWQGCSKGTAEEPGVCFLPGSGKMIIQEFKEVPSPETIFFGFRKGFSSF